MAPADGNAAKDGRVKAGDVLTRCSATILKEGKSGAMEQGHGARLYDSWEQVWFDCTGKQFDTVSCSINKSLPDTMAAACYCMAAL